MNILNTIVYLLITVSIFAIPVCVIIGIIMGTTHSHKKGTSEAKRMKNIAWQIALYPIIIFFFILTVWGLINIAYGTFAR